MSEMALTADHLVVIGQGRLLADTSMADFIECHSRSCVRIRTPDRERLLDALHGAGIPVEESGDGVLEAEGGKAEHIGELAARHHVVLHELSSRHSSLEEAFMRLTAPSVEYHARTGPPQRPWGADGEAGPWQATAGTATHTTVEG
jgi:ABC-2 type transport system ATP-binding protein